MNALDKEEFRIKLEEINKLVQDKDYKGAMNIVDSIDWRRVKNVRTLCVVGEIYAANGRYEDSKEIFLLAYHKASIGKNILYRLIEISLRMDDINEAEEFFEEYKQVASNDSTQYILQYKIARAKNSSLNEQIRILEEYKEQEFTEKWSYELAALYYKAGEKRRKSLKLKKWKKRQKTMSRKFRSAWKAFRKRFQRGSGMSLEVRLRKRKKSFRKNPWIWLTRPVSPGKMRFRKKS